MIDKSIYINLKKNSYLWENVVDVVVGLLIYKIFGFEVAVISILGLIMSDIAMIMYKSYE